jgi:hypothetical protein
VNSDICAIHTRLRRGFDKGLPLSFKHLQIASSKAPSCRLSLKHLDDFSMTPKDISPIRLYDNDPYAIPNPCQTSVS